MANAIVAATAIPPKAYFDSASLRGAILAELQNKQVPIFIGAMEETTTTWRHKPVFFSKFYFTGGRIRVYIYTLDKPWNWLENGTSVRYASMQRGFIRKTNPGQLHPGPGAFPDPMFVSKKKPHRGIEPRGWRELIMKSERPLFLREINAAIGRALRKTKKTP